MELLWKVACHLGLMPGAQLRHRRFGGRHDIPKIAVDDVLFHVEHKSFFSQVEMMLSEECRGLAWVSVIRGHLGDRKDPLSHPRKAENPHPETPRSSRPPYLHLRLETLVFEDPDGAREAYRAYQDNLMRESQELLVSTIR